MKKNILAIALCAAMCGACSEVPDSSVETPSTEQKLEVTFLSSIASTKVASDQFEIGDQITVSALDGTTAFATNVAYSYNGSIFTSESPIVYTSTDQVLTFRAVYPASSSFADTFLFTAFADQSADDNYEMSDLLISETSPTSDNCPKLSFDHKMSNIVINITTAGKSSGTMTLDAKLSAQCDITSGTYSATGSASSVTPAVNETGGFTAILAPQTLAADSVVATYVYDGITYTWEPSADVVFASGYKYTYNWSLVDREVTLESVINDWGDGGTASIEGK